LPAPNAAKTAAGIHFPFVQNDAQTLIWVPGLTALIRLRLTKKMTDQPRLKSFIKRFGNYSPNTANLSGHAASKCL